MTKEEISDLKSLVQRIEQTAIELQVATWNKKEADMQLENWLLLHEDYTGIKKEGK